MRVGDKPKIQYVPIEQPTARNQGLGQGGPSDPKDAKQAKGTPKADDGVVDSFGKTSDQTDDINPITSKKSRITGGKEALDGIKLPGLPSEQGQAPFEALDDAFGAAGDAMDAGLSAQSALGLTTQTRFEAVVLPDGAPEASAPPLNEAAAAQRVPTPNSQPDALAGADAEGLLEQVTTGRDVARLRGNHSLHNIDSKRSEEESHG